MSAAKALPKKPERVIATWMVARNLAGSRVRRKSRPARLLPCSAMRSSLASFTVSTAISALAKMALRAMRTA